nr:MAG TPA: hypothetical protein [Caudoviricetes sp.]
MSISGKSKPSTSYFSREYISKRTEVNYIWLIKNKRLKALLLKLVKYYVTADQVKFLNQ